MRLGVRGRLVGVRQRIEMNEQMGDYDGKQGAFHRLSVWDENFGW